MGSGFNEAKGQVVVEDLVRMIHENRGYLSEIDGVIGDGDHGINMDKGFQIAGKRLEGKQEGLSGAMNILGDVLLDEIGGSMGPLYGMFFKRMARVAQKVEKIDAEVLEEMLESAYDGLQSLGSAEIGDKTMLDTLYTALESLKGARAAYKDFSAVIDEMIGGAKAGWEGTKDLVAKVGRASRLGERSRGVLDAGATSCYLILKTLGEGMKELAG